MNGTKCLKNILMKTFISLILREFKLFGKNSVMLAIFFGAPIAYALLIGYVYEDAKITDLPIVIVDMDNTPMSHKLIDAIDDNQYTEVAEVFYENSNIRQIIIDKNYHAVVTIPDRFEADIQQKRYPEIDVDVNAGNMLTGNYATTGIMTVMGTINAGVEIESIKKGGVPSAIARQQYESFKINITRFFNPSSNYLHFLWPGMLGVILQQVILLTLALSFAQEFEKGTFKNLLKISKSSTYLIFTKAIPYWIAAAILWFPLIRIFFPMFQIPLIEEKAAYWLISSLFILSLTFVGIAVSIILKTQLKATEVLMVIATPSFIISGQTWPISQMPEWTQVISN